MHCFLKLPYSYPVDPTAYLSHYYCYQAFFSCHISSTVSVRTSVKYSDLPVVSSEYEVSASHIYHLSTGNTLVLRWTAPSASCQVQRTTAARVRWEVSDRESDNERFCKHGSPSWCWKTIIYARVRGEEWERLMKGHVLDLPHQSWLRALQLVAGVGSLSDVARSHFVYIYKGYSQRFLATRFWNTQMAIDPLKRIFCNTLTRCWFQNYLACLLKVPEDVATLFGVDDQQHTRPRVFFNIFSFLGNHALVTRLMHDSKDRITISPPPHRPGPDLLASLLNCLADVLVKTLSSGRQHENPI